MTPAIDLAKQAGIEHRVHQYSHDSGSASYGAEAAEKLSLPPQQVFKTLVVQLEPAELVVAVIPVCTQLNMKRLAKVAGAKKAAMADPGAVQRSSGYIMGGVSPLGQKKALRTFIDDSANGFITVFVSAGRRGLEIELSSADLSRLTDAVFAGLSS
ncbi:Cys-tRNA(Pro) deacylase [Ketobacter sp. MCCC 1A13808]|uniref:Cys-tRNA(Pro) deacylase n=1 Tax=Ketobacter sp. MCCC 1A13808 TaxID=2602738 RepID=UPI0012EC4604|nr:Cys-tRNA(Pro) deacylase [Ketobacter sp. MCCC 1A13808]MVF11917.1 Cys-tRNA(Pro) deacylase [Ketobacter sp. MCCC 1A13808]